MLVGSKQYRYEPILDWFNLPRELTLGWVAAVAIDSQDRVYVYSRSEQPMVVFDRNGHFLTSWGKDVLKDAHGIFIDRNDHVFCVERETHCIRKFTTDGELLMTIGSPNQEGAEGQPFRLPTDIGFDSYGDIYVSDGYDNARVHKFSSTGEFILSWGSPGKGSGEFNLPHCVRVDRHDRIWVADRSNNRIQFFDTEGRYLDEWGDFNQPDTIHIDIDDIVYVAELEQRVSILNMEGHLLARWGCGERLPAIGEFLGCPHGIWSNSRGDLYVGEVQTDGRIQKFLRQH